MKHSQSSLFLMELIVAILFFALASAICMQLFVQAKIINNQSIEQEQAMRISSEIIERYKNDQPLKKQMSFSKDHETYLAKIDINNQTITIDVYVDQDKIYSTNYYHYQQRTVR